MCEIAFHKTYIFQNPSWLNQTFSGSAHILSKPFKILEPLYTRSSENDAEYYYV